MRVHPRALSYPYPHTPTPTHTHIHTRARAYAHGHSRSLAHAYVCMMGTHEASRFSTFLSLKRSSRRRTDSQTAMLHTPCSSNKCGSYSWIPTLHIPQMTQGDGLFVGCLTSQQHASVSQGRICSDNFTCCHTEVEVADQTFHLIQSQYTDTRPASPSTDPIMPGAWQGSHWKASF